jgi:hypothetical protein
MLHLESRYIRDNNQSQKTFLLIGHYLIIGYSVINYYLVIACPVPSPQASGSGVLGY